MLKTKKKAAKKIFDCKWPNSTPIELPNGLLPPSLHNAVEAFTRLMGTGLPFNYYCPFFVA